MIIEDNKGNECDVGLISSLINEDFIIPRWRDTSRVQNGETEGPEA